MKIEKFKKLKNGVYELQLDNYDKILTYEEVILKYELLINREISSKTLKEINELNSYYECYYRALRLINKKAYTRKELFIKLKDEELDFDTINKALNELEKQGYLNDKVYSNGFVNNKIITTTHGPNRIKKELSDRGVDSKIISEVMENYTEEIEKGQFFRIIEKGLFGIGIIDHWNYYRGGQAMDCTEEEFLEKLYSSSVFKGLRLKSEEDKNE